MAMNLPTDMETLRCRYASKRCNNVRSFKKNGELHSLCEAHRLRANENQRRLDGKRKVVDLIWDEVADISLAMTVSRKRLKTQEEHKCLYRSKPCENPRAVKQNGLLHTFCEYHRLRANETQRRVEARRRAGRRAQAHITTTAMLIPTICTDSASSTSTLEQQFHASTTQETQGVGVDVDVDVNLSQTVSQDPCQVPQLLRADDLALLQEFLFE